MSKALLVATAVAGLALATSTLAEPFGDGRSREGSLEPSPRAEAEPRHDLWERGDRHAERRHRRRHAPPAQAPSPGYPDQTPYGYDAYGGYGGYNYGGGYSGDYDNAPPRPAPPPSPRGLHNGLWYY